ncbi:MAG: hypothetical protein JWM20_734 [Patescibacteria group bacterium]|nr:hypothetical protein [Patescibacteria group bacterium]
MNVHPVFVHFPIALLTLYSIMELLQVPKFNRSNAWQNIKSAFLIIGTLGSFAAFYTGGIAENSIGATKLIETHSTFALITIIFFAFLSVIYLIRIVHTAKSIENMRAWFVQTKYISSVWKILTIVSNWILAQEWLLVILGVAALALISVTGALGGAVAYGPNTDPFVSFFYHLFF